MNEQRKPILEMLAEGKLTVDEAERLIAALADPPAPTATGPEPKPKKARYLRVLVDANDNGEKARVNVRVPIQLLRAGVKLASLIPDNAMAQVNVGLNRSGWSIDLTKIKAEDVDELIDHLTDMTVEVQDPEANVHVFCE